MTAVLSFLGWRGIVGILAAAILSGFLVAAKLDARHWHKQSDRFENLYHQDQAAFAQTVANYRAAAETARQADAANKARAEAEQAAINERTSHDYEARIAAARALAERLRGASATHSSAGGSASVPLLSTPLSGSAQAPAQDGLPDALIATEQAIQLDELIKWVTRQHAVDLNKENGHVSK